MKNPKPLFSFGVVSDVQYSELITHNPDVRPAPLGIKKLTSAIENLNSFDLEFIINLGDLIDRDATSYGLILKVVAKSKAEFWHVLGNHDFCGPDYDYGYKKEALSALNMTDSTRYYYKDVKNWRFIILDSNEIGTIECKEGSKEWLEGSALLKSLEEEGKINAKPWNGAISDKQLTWLTNTIKEASVANKQCLVFSHAGIYPTHRENMLNSQQLLNLLTNEATVKVFINGHNHDGGFGVYKGLPCWNIEGMMDFVDKTAYAVVKVYNDKLEVKGFGRTKNQEIPFRTT